jgi:hypothetical protein
MLWLKPAVSVQQANSVSTLYTGYRQTHYSGRVARVIAVGQRDVDNIRALLKSLDRVTICHHVVNDVAVGLLPDTTPAPLQHGYRFFPIRGDNCYSHAYSS